jgi:hypothetical protein
MTESWIAQSDPDITRDEMHAVAEVLQSPHLTSGPASVLLGTVPPLQAEMSGLAAALGLAQLKRVDAILAKRKLVASLYYECIQSFEGIKPPYIGPDVEEVHWFLHVVHLGTRFSRSSRGVRPENRTRAGGSLLSPAAPATALLRHGLPARQLPGNPEGRRSRCCPTVPHAPDHGPHRVHRRDHERRLGERWCRRGNLANLTRRILMPTLTILPAGNGTEHVTIERLGFGSGL